MYLDPPTLQEVEADACLASQPPCAAEKRRMAHNDAVSPPLNLYRPSLIACMPQEEEAERKAVEEEARKQAEAERRKVERAERRAQLKKEGKLLTGKAKKGAERLAAVREQFLKQAGLDGGSTGMESAAVLDDAFAGWS